MRFRWNDSLPYSRKNIPLPGKRSEPRILSAISRSNFKGHPC